ncbi:hypothetical protein HOE22_02555 [Candidatus Woesearchaeota archaeon]|jgi:hypothetical protein|nr:hypothetical protein [Candidatus Woesearchaeota archaeon]MBT4730550.1 hypothetical protein [Candidatus Woesearchaeota archaeon]MBT7556600.1 hypothetical protein [Candidatus Woesearchaeota archaeon]
MKMHNINPEDFVMDEIVSIELVGEEDTVDITVEDTHMFFANGIYSHNSSLEEDVIDASKVAESYAKVMIADFVISMSRKVEDKIANTGRFHVIKNRFGVDGITFPASINTNNGSIKIFEANTQDGQTTQKKMDNSEEYLRKQLANKYNSDKDMGGFE